MAAPTIQDVFGLNSEVLSATASVTVASGDEVLIIRKSDFADWTTATGSKPERWLAEILKKITAFDATDTTEVPDFESSLATRTLATRNSVDKIGFVYQTIIYQTATGLASAPDADLV